MNRLINGSIKHNFFTIVSCHQISSKFPNLCFVSNIVTHRFKDDLKFPSTTDLSL